MQQKQRTAEYKKQLCNANFKHGKKYFAHIFFPYMKMTNNYYQKDKQRLKKIKREKKHYHHECNKNLSEEQKKKLLVEYMRNYYLAHKK